MRDDAPSLTARGVAMARSALDRPASATGDPDAEARLEMSLLPSTEERAVDERAAMDARRAERDGFRDFVAVRTRFFDEAVVGAIAGGIRQIVILGAGYDGRALRFRTPSVRFFEVDHPATQRDKRERLAAVNASLEGITFVAADFTEPRLAERLTAAGHDPAQPSLFTCEGVLLYLPEAWFRELLRVAHAQSSGGSELAASISTFVAPADDAERIRREQREAALAQSGEPVLTVPSRDDALQWVTEAGWRDVRVEPATEPAAEASSGRLLVSARRTD
jgi:methyltransferase (TIGR00027 family)